MSSHPFIGRQYELDRLKYLSRDSRPKLAVLKGRRRKRADVSLIRHVLHEESHPAREILGGLVSSGRLRN